MSTISFEIMSICANGAAPARRGFAWAAPSASDFVPAPAAVSVAGGGFVKQALKHVATIRLYTDGWPPGPQDRTSA